MYEINTLLRIARFLANTFVGLVAGFILGYLFALGNLPIQAFLKALHV